MNNIFKKITAFTATTMMAISLASCDVTETPSVNFGFKSVDTAAEYNESLTAFEVGKRFYSSIKIQINTDKKKAHDYKVEIIVPKTKEVEVKEMGGLNPDTNNWDPDKEQTVMTYTVKGYKEATPEKILFYGTPTDEGEVEMQVHIYDEDGEEINSGWSRTIFFEYQLQGE